VRKWTRGKEVDKKERRVISGRILDFGDFGVRFRLLDLEF
jgi:hypothetical protein